MKLQKKTGGGAGGEESWAGASPAVEEKAFSFCLPGALRCFCTYFYAAASSYSPQFATTPPAQRETIVKENQE